MSEATFKVEFRAELPDPIRVGDRIVIGGAVTVHAVEAELVDITEFGSKGSRVSLGDVTVRLHSNTLDVEPVLP